MWFSALNTATPTYSANNTASDSQVSLTGPPQPSRPPWSFYARDFDAVSLDPRSMQETHAMPRPQHKQVIRDGRQTLAAHFRGTLCTFFESRYLECMRADNTFPWNPFKCAFPASPPKTQRVSVFFSPYFFRCTHDVLFCATHICPTTVRWAQ